ncbi:MAG: alpha-2-macroglobulin family protein [Acidobacteriota bacterium]
MKKISITSLRFTLLLLIALTGSIRAQDTPRVESFSPQGVVKEVRQVHVRFSESMVAFGDPRATLMPFDLDCAEPGKARWVDDKNWAYDFDRDLPAGVRCQFRLKDETRTLAGKQLGGERLFRFSTGGPSILSANPYEGSEGVDEEQIFLLELDAEPIESSVLSNVFFAVEGIAERVGVRILTGERREQLLKSLPRYERDKKGPLLLLQARQRFPVGAKISLVWGKGVTSKSGVANDGDQTLPFKTRSAFIATFHCQRENAEAECIPLTPMRLTFAAAVPWSKIRGAVLRGPDGKVWKPEAPTQEEDEKHVYHIVFKGPFPEKSQFRIEIPSGIEDDSGRRLVNANRFPLAVKTDQYPPLVKFAADFGILELKSGAVLPVTVRNLEPEVGGDLLELDPAASFPAGVRQQIGGRLSRIPSDRPDQILFWLKRIAARSWDDRDKSIFASSGGPATRPFSLPKPGGAKAFEVIGIPLKDPGFYVVELKSEILGASLLGKPGPMFVPTTALVTNLSIHLKTGIESSLVWVTALDTGKPSGDTLVTISDCGGGVLWSGRTDARGVVLPGKLPAREAARRCSMRSTLDGGLLVTAQLGEDFSFLHSSWDEGIEAWRFQLPTEHDERLLSAHTIFDRTLLRAGETVHMKHILRRHVGRGFAQMPERERPKLVRIEHSGSEQKYELPLRWDAKGIAETQWEVPRGAKLGQYGVSLALSSNDEDHRNSWTSGQFRVEEYRVPLMRGTIHFPSGPLVRPTEVPVDLAVQYLSGGPAGKLPVRLKHQLRSRWVSGFDDFEGFSFANGTVKEGVVRYGEDEEENQSANLQSEKKEFELQTVDLTLDQSGTLRTQISKLPSLDRPLEILTELEFQDPNGETQTISSRIPLWSASQIVGIKPESWTASKEALKFQIAVVDLAGKPVAGAAVKADLFQRKTYSHRKRLVGGFYAYEHFTETKKVGKFCEGKTDLRGLLLCGGVSPVSGEVILQASSADAAGHRVAANQEAWVVGKADLWFAAEDHDRMDVLPERRRYEPGQKARLQVRMPFRDATALVTVEREGISDVYIHQLSGKEPVVEIPVKENYAPNVYISVLAVRGRADGVQPTATVDLGRPSFKLGIAQLDVNWKAHELKVAVSADRAVYKVREKARVRIVVRKADGRPLPAGGEIALAAVDEGLLELMPNSSWDLLESMMGKRGYGIENSTAAMHVVGKRHFGLKALPQGGGGGRQPTRELFDTLLLWKGRVALNARGEATVDVPLNDSLTSFRIAAVATAGDDLFGSGSASIRSTQDLMILPGVAPLVREGDTIRSEVTVRNVTERRMDVEVTARIRELTQPLAPFTFPLAAGESRQIAWDVTAPIGRDALHYEFTARENGAAGDIVAARQKILPAVPVRIFQATLAQMETSLTFPVARPADAVAGRGGVQTPFLSTLVGSLSGLTDYMQRYPYTCFEQKLSRAVALRDEALWKNLMLELPSYLDGDGLVKYFPGMVDGSDVLAAYLVAIADEAGWTIPEDSREKVLAGLRGFAEGRILRFSALPTADLSIRKLAAVEALSRSIKNDAELLSSITIEPNLWPTSAVLDWFNIVRRFDALPRRQERLGEAEQILKSRLNFQGTTMGFSTERTDRLWWLMVSTDTNAVRLVLALVDAGLWKADLPRVTRGALGRQRRGHWDLTVANAWGRLAVEKFTRAFEATPVTGTSTARLAGESQAMQWAAAPQGKDLQLGWPAQPEDLSISHAGTGRPWVTVQSLAAIPLRAPVSTGFTIHKTLTPVSQKQPGRWSRGDVVRVELRVEAQSDMTWVVISDPIPGGAAILGGGLGRDSALATRGEESKGWAWPAFQERSFEAYRAYYEYIPKGEWTVQYTIRLNSEGTFHLPATRAEAMYAPEMFGEIPNADLRVHP